MKIAVRYQSRGGNTEGMAKIIAKVAGVTAEPVSVPLEGKVDLLFLGGAVYMWKIDSQLQAFLEKLDSKKVGRIAAFSSTGLMPFAIWQIKRYAKKAGIKSCRKSLCLKILLQGHSMLGREGGHFTNEQKARIKKFASETVKKMSEQREK